MGNTKRILEIRRATCRLDLKALAHLQNKLHACQRMDYSVHSRIHSLDTFCSNSEATCFVKREDELSFGISGNKIRKFQTLIPYLINQNCREAVILGGPYSNNVLSLSQLLIENAIEPTLFLRGNKPNVNKGNFLFLQMLVPPHAMHWIPRKHWNEIDERIKSYTSHRENCIVIPEGAAMFPAFPGALSLPLDIVENETQLNQEFDHIFVDAGTGFSAAALLLCFAYLGRKSICHITLLADTESDFKLKLHNWHNQFEKWLGKKTPLPSRYVCTKNMLASSFGATNQALFQFLTQFARKYGFFLDPIYSGKLFHHVKTSLEVHKEIKGNILILHSGGALTLSGFQEQLEKTLK